MIEDDLKERAFLERICRDTLSLLYLFGSHAAGKVTPLSDVDVAVLLADDVPRSLYGDEQIRLMVEIGKHLRRDDIDVVVLNAADAVIRFNVLAGELIFARSETDRIDFEVRTRRDYFDTKPIRDYRHKALIERQLRAG